MAKSNGEIAANKQGTVEPNAEIESLRTEIERLQKENKSLASKKKGGDKCTSDAARLAKKLNKEAEKLVSIRLFKDNDRYRDDLFVSVNDYKATVPRGQTVEVPLYIAKIIENMDEQIAYADSLAADLSNEFEKSTNSLEK